MEELICKVKRGSRGRRGRKVFGIKGLIRVRMVKVVFNVGREGDLR